jgi:hypothetical protein
VRVKVAGHWWRLTDATAGCRTHAGTKGGGKSWIGWTDMTLTCHAVGLEVIVESGSASEPEYRIHPRAYEKLKRVLGGPPRSVISDKGLAIKEVLEAHSNDGVFSVMPYRGSGVEPKPADRERFDRHGIPRCENCGARGRFISFQQNPKPRVFFECARKPFPECGGRQSMLCSEDPRFILPLWRDTELYQGLKQAGIEYERVHRMSRQRNATSGNNFSNRHKRKGRDWHQLVAEAANCADWVKLCWRNGWLPGSTCRVDPDPEPMKAADKLDKFMSRRLDNGLEGHYGERAFQFELGGRRLPQYKGVTPTPAVAPKRAPGGPKRRALTPLPAKTRKAPAAAAAQPAKKPRATGKGGANAQLARTRKARARVRKKDPPG